MKLNALVNYSSDNNDHFGILVNSKELNSSKSANQQNLYWSFFDLEIMKFLKKYFLILIFGLLLSPFVSAELNEKPLLQKLCIPKNLAKNQMFRSVCSIVRDESSELTFEWLLNDQKLVTYNRLEIEINEDSSELIIKSLSIDDLEELKCTASNKYGQDNQKDCYILIVSF